MGDNFGNSGDAVSFLGDPLDLYGGKSGAAADRALQAQKDAANQSNATLRYMYDTQRADSAPWREAGTAALGQLQDNKFMDNWQQDDPGYQFRMDEGSKAINSSLAARGLSNSGSALKSLTKYGQDYSSNEYNNAYSRQYNRLSGLAGIGNSSNQALGNQTGQFGTQLSNNQSQLGNAIAANQIGQSNTQAAKTGGFLQGVGTIGAMFL